MSIKALFFCIRRGERNKTRLDLSNVAGGWKICWHAKGLVNSCWVLKRIEWFEKIIWGICWNLFFLPMFKFLSTFGTFVDIRNFYRHSKFLSTFEIFVDLNVLIEFWKIHWHVSLFLLEFSSTFEICVDIWNFCRHSKFSSTFEIFVDFQFYRITFHWHLSLFLLEFLSTFESFVEIQNFCRHSKIFVDFQSCRSILKTLCALELVSQIKVKISAFELLSTFDFFRHSNS